MNRHFNIRIITQHHLLSHPNKYTIMRVQQIHSKNIPMFQQANTLSCVIKLQFLPSIQLLLIWKASAVMWWYQNIPKPLGMSYNQWVHNFGRKDVHKAVGVWNVLETSFNGYSIMTHGNKAHLDPVNHYLLTTRHNNLIIERFGPKYDLPQHSRCCWYIE